MTLQHHHPYHFHHFLLLPLLLLQAVLFLWPCNAELPEPVGYYCSEDIRASYNKSIANANHLLVELASKAPSNGFLASSYGSGKYIVYGLAQCRGDVVGMADCSTCIQAAAKLIRTTNICPRENDARIWFDMCFLRYSYNDNFIGKVDTSIDVHYNNIDDVIDTEQFNKELAKLMKRIRSEALKPKNAGLGKGQKKLTLFITLYTLVQCTQDLSPISCAQCLAIAEANFVTYCANKRGCRIFYSSCFARYEFYPFFYPVSSAPELSNNTQKVVVHP